MLYIPYVNVRQGTRSTSQFSRGNTLPLTQLPFGMAGFVPATRNLMHGQFYHPEDRSLECVRLTHQPSPWIGDYGVLLLLPQRGAPALSPNMRWSGYRPEDAVLQPDYLKLHFLRYRVMFELTPTIRGAAIRLTYHGDEQALLSILPVDGTQTFRLDAESKKLFGSTDMQNNGNACHFKMYYVLDFDEPPCAEESMFAENGQIHKGAASGEGPGAEYHIAFKEKIIHARLAISYISEEQALRNLENELSNSTFDQIHEKANTHWEEILSRIEAETVTEEQMKTFYSCLYRLFLYPNICFEYDRQNKPYHFCPSDGTVRKGKRYTNNGFWDTYRTVYPMFSLVARNEFADIIDGFIQDYRDCGWLPRWTAMGEFGIMPGTLIDSVIGEAAVSGVSQASVLEDGLKGMLRHAKEVSNDEKNGRNNIDQYLKFGYIPYTECNESVNWTLDFAYGDYCIAQTAKVLGYPDIEKEFRARDKNYQHLFDKKTGFMRAKDANGEFREPFNSFAWGRDYTEGSAWQNSFAVPHDIEGLAELYGSKEAFCEKLDELFSNPPIYYVGGYEKEIHEMTEMASVDFGQCAISNQPSMHIPYLYAVLGQKNKTDFWVRRIMRKLFNSSDGGFPGDEDNGSMACWYLLSALGLYSLCPASGNFVIGSPLVKKAIIHLQNGESLEIQTENQTADVWKLKTISFNGNDYTEATIETRELLRGGCFRYVFDH